MGDLIISHSCDIQLSSILNENFVLRFPTHTPIAHFYQDNLKLSGGRYAGPADYKFIYGTNLLNTNMFSPSPLWNINMFNKRMAKDAICVGVGMGSGSTHVNLYTRLLLTGTLNKELFHSTRDERTALFLRNLGLKALNTGCASIWGLSNLFCSTIPHAKSMSVLFTLTDYNKDPKNDKLLIKILKKNYKKVFCWIQGIGDYSYLSELNMLDDIIIIPPSIQLYEKILNTGVDYVGTRLHAGIKAMQCRCRTIIIAIDNRAIDMARDIDLICLSRVSISNKLEDLVNSDFTTCLNINETAISDWKNQFDEFL
jgi:polysaccharide pyruvyl transferase WcaK-like protein